jgi:hypothetical protein
MNVWRSIALAMIIGLAGATSGHAEDCEAVAANLHTQVPEIAVSEKSSDDQAVIVMLKNPDVEELTLTCTGGDVKDPPVLTAKANAAWPSSNFYDVLSSAGAVIASTTTSAIRSGSVLCAQRAMTADNNTTTYDINGVHFECTTMTGIGGSTHIRLSKLKEVPPPQPQP